MTVRLLDSNEVCNLLGISKSTLYRWCGVSEEYAGLPGLDGLDGLPGLAGLPSEEFLRMFGKGKAVAKPVLAGRRLQSKVGVEETPSDFPRPFKIGRSFKWKDVEIMDWLETRRV